MERSGTGQGWDAGGAPSHHKCAQNTTAGHPVKLDLSLELDLTWSCPALNGGWTGDLQRQLPHWVTLLPVIVPDVI